MGKIYEADFADKNKKTKTISELFESIEFYRSQGRSVSEIHAAFCRSELWEKSQSSFAHECYQYRRQQAQADAGDSQSAKPQSRGYFKSRSSADPELPDSSPSDAKTKSAPAVDNRTGIRPGLTLAEKREISVKLFEQKRNNW